MLHPPGAAGGAAQGAQLPVGPPTSAELRAIIVEPAAHAGSTVAPELVATVVAEAADQPGALPLVAHALRETWHRGSGPVLHLDDYRATGGMRGAVAQTAEAAYAFEPPARQALMRAVFLRLTMLGEGTEDTRRPVPRTELDGLEAPEAPALAGAYSGSASDASPDGGADDVAALLHRLAAARLIVLADGTVEVAHEAVIRAWPRLRRWLTEDRDALRVHRRLSSAAQQWDELARDGGALYRGAQLTTAQTWSREHGTALNELEHDFLTASTTAHRPPPGAAGSGTHHTPPAPVHRHAGRPARPLPHRGHDRMGPVPKQRTTTAQCAFRTADLPVTAARRTVDCSTRGQS
ncbi:hypothetical protein ABZ851_37050 [Streptomyces sp. NPDC047049]|uniref:nSTAND1 domain-containing NTPase n=1 Tax=Streptomyces sp. NPDC047049 TaxID=3156688 RepID=UPI0033E1EDC5